MGHRLISISDTQVDAAGLFDEFEKRMRDALVEGATPVALCLKKEMGANVELLGWLGKWQKTFAGNNRQLIIVAADARQLQYLELSHPDEHLMYVATIEELINSYPIFSISENQQHWPALKVPPVIVESVIIPPSPPPPIAPPLPTQPVKVIQPVNVQPPEPVSVSHTEPASPAADEQIVVGGEVIKLSGEYACMGCGSTRMYAKGDIASDCTNPECPISKNGWKLVFELF